MVILPHRRKAFRATPSSGGGTDPYFANVSALLHMQGANNGTVFTDSSSNALTCTALGNAKTITTDFKWGNSCANFDGSGDYITVAASSAMDFGSGNYTVEMWVKWSSVSGAQTLIDFGNGATYLRFDNGNTLYFFDAGAMMISGATISQLASGTWYYIAFVRTGNTRSVYVNGSLIGSASRVGTSGSSSISTKIGARYDSALAFNGKMQDVRVTKSVARDVTTIPTAQFPDS